MHVFVVFQSFYISFVWQFIRRDNSRLKLSLQKFLLLCLRLWLKLSGMDITEACASDETDAEKRHSTIDSTKRSTESSCRQYVNELLDLSEEDYCREHNMHLFQCRTGWEDAVSQINTTETELHTCTQWFPLITVFWHCCII